jgi:hypothetical protein
MTSEWRYEIQHGPDGEANYAWVYNDKNEMVCTAQTHHAIEIVRSVNGLPEAIAALEFYRDAWSSKPNKHYGGLEWSPKEGLLDDCGERARATLTKLKG